MLTKVILEGPFGKEFGREWDIVAKSPADALRLINANKPGVFGWIKKNLDIYANYKVLCEYDNGKTDLIDSQGVFINAKLRKIRFVPVVQGAAAGIRLVVGAVLVAVALYTGNPYIGAAGASLMLGSVVEMLTGKPSIDKNAKTDNTSYYFDGPTNTSTQGVPVQLVYGRNVLVGSQAISAAITVDQLL